MSQDFKTKVPQSALEEMYGELAHMKPLQAYLAQINDNAGTADVFVEEERTVVFSQQVPAVTWYDFTAESGGSYRSYPALLYCGPQTLPLWRSKSSSPR